MNLGQTIRTLRKKQGFNQGEFAERIEISQPSMYQIESGRKHPRPDTMKKISEALSIPAAFIYCLSAEREDIRLGRQPFFDNIFPVIQKAIEAIIAHE